MRRFSLALALSGFLTAAAAAQTPYGTGSAVAHTTGASSFGFIERWGLRPDGSQAAILAVFGSAVYLYDLDPASPGYLQLSGTLSVPPVFMGFSPIDMDVSKRDGDFAVICGASPGWVGRLGFDLTNPALYSWTPSPVLLVDSGSVGLNFDENELAVATHNPPELVFVDVDSLSQIARTSLPGGGNIYTTVWR